MSKKITFNLLVLILTSFQIACGDAGFIANQNANEKVAINSDGEFTSNESSNTGSETNLIDELKPIETISTEEVNLIDQVKPSETILPEETKPISLGTGDTLVIKPDYIKPIATEVVVENKPTEICRKGVFGKKICTTPTKPVQNCSTNIFGKKVCVPIVKPIAQNCKKGPFGICINPIKPIKPIEVVIPERKVCIDVDGDGKGVFESTTEPCTGNKQLDKHIYAEVLKPHNQSAIKSVHINNIPCGNLQTMVALNGCFEKVSVNSQLFNDYARSKGITKAGALVKFYLAGNTINPLDKTFILVSPYNPLASNSIDYELNWLFAKSKNDGSKLPTLLNYLHKNGISVLFVSFGHLANTSLPVVEKSRALAQVIEKFTKIREPNKGNPGFEKTNIMGLSLGGVVAKKALTILEQQNLDHKINLYLSMDSPHLGAHVPLGLQYLPTAASKVFSYAKSKTNLPGILDKIVDDIFDLDFITTPLAQGASALGQAANASSTFVEDYFNDIPSNELIAYNVLAKDGLHKAEYLQMRRDTSYLPSKTNKNIAIANGSLSGKTLPKGTYFDVRTGQSNKVNITLMVNPRGAASTYSYAWIKFPNRNTLYTSRRTYDFSYFSGEQKITEDTIPCGTTTDIIKGAELGINLAVSQNWNERVKVYNYHTCFIPTASALASVDGKAFKNSSFNASQSAFHEIIGGAKNTQHMFFSQEITNQIISKFERYRKQK